MSASPESVDVLNERPGRPATWTTVNAGEAAFPGVPTPLSWTWSWWPTEYGIRGAFVSIGAFARGFARPPDLVAERVLTIRYGNVAINLDLFRAVADALPNSSGDEIERAWFGSVRPGAGGLPRRSRYPVVATRMPVTAIRSRSAIRRLADPTDRWWRQVVGQRDLDIGGARALLVESQRRYAQISRPHVVVGMVTQGLYERVRALCDEAGMLDDAGLLVPGGEEEARWLAELWDVAHCGAGVEGFLHGHGYHGPLEGELSSPTWRIDPRPVHRLIDAYRRSGPRESPAQLAERRAHARQTAEARLFASLLRPQQVAARALLGAARAYMPLRESGRATFLRAYDGARHAAQMLGGHLSQQGLLDSEDDVYYLTFAELTACDPPDDCRALVAARREQREHYRSINLPSLWTGDPTPERSAAERMGPYPDEPVVGQGVSAGVVEGIVRVVLDPGDSEDVDDGDILVCRATDPSWAGLFYIAGAVVTDIGGEMSHGAIVARELGLPAVVNTQDGTRRLRTGDVVRVDGSLGSVTVLS